MKEKLPILGVTIGMLLIAAGIVMPLLTHEIVSDLFRYIYAAGALILLASRVCTGYDGKNLRLKRLFRLETWSALFFCVAALMLFYNRDSLRDGLAFTLAGGIVQIYTSIMIPYTSAKDNQ